MTWKGKPIKEEPYSKIEGKWISDDDYIVIHRLAVNSEIKNKGIATKILEFSEKEKTIRGKTHSTAIGLNTADMD